MYLSLGPTVRLLRVGIVFITLEPLSLLASFLNIAPWSFDLETAYTSPQHTGSLVYIGTINIISSFVLDIVMTREQERAAALLL